MKTIPLAEAKAKLSGLIDEVANRDERITITKRGRPRAILMSPEEVAGLEATLEIMSDTEFYAEIVRNRAALDRGQGREYDLDELLGEEVTRARPTRGPAARSGRARAAAPARDKEKAARGARSAARRSRSR